MSVRTILAETARDTWRRFGTHWLAFVAGMLVADLLAWLR